MINKRQVLRLAAITVVLVVASLIYLWYASNVPVGVAPRSTVKAEVVEVPDNVDFQPVVVVPNRFAPITKLDVMTVAEATGWLRDNELVLGVVVGGQARAYPINMLTGPTREIVNDTLADVPIAATW